MKYNFQHLLSAFALVFACLALVFVGFGFAKDFIGNDAHADATLPEVGEESSNTLTMSVANAVSSAMTQEISSASSSATSSRPPIGQDDTPKPRRSVLTAEQLEAVKAEFNRERGTVLRAQGDLSRIEARLVRQVERTLIEKGLLEAIPSEHSRGEIGGDGFLWPVSGPITAHFFDAAYEAFFGVPHYGMDIAVSQGTAVRSAAEGIVMVAVDGGYGYSYIVIGHRDEYSTVYGHLSKIGVAVGDHVTKGQIIGATGGTRDTPGAGLRTTGAHLHFEVLHKGKNINPGSVL